jgi:mRNA-degrading endonuclease YafQ of YafQ-DinJ toxin-antitoxin module
MIKITFKGQFNTMYRLSNHALTKSMKGKWAFSITDDIRIIYEKIGPQTIRFLAIGKHTEVYGNK